MKRILSLLLAFTLVLSSTVFTLADTETEDLKVYVGKTKTISLWLEGTTKWSSSNKKVATVTSNGKVTGVKSGTATITAKNGNDTYIYNVTVYIKRTEAEVKEIINNNLTGTPTEVSKKAFSANPKTLVSELRYLCIGDYIYINGEKDIIVNRTKFRVTIYNGSEKIVYSYNRLRAMGNSVKVYTRY